MLTGAARHQELLALAEDGDANKVDKLVGDIYGDDYQGLGVHVCIVCMYACMVVCNIHVYTDIDIQIHIHMYIGLSADTVASSFGKLVNSDVREKAAAADLAASLVRMVSWNIAHIARLVASQEGARTIIFTGSFMHDNAVSQRRLASAFRYWSNGDSQALFMKHEGYVGALGALAMSTHQMLADAHGHRR